MLLVQMRSRDTASQMLPSDARDQVLRVQQGPSMPMSLHRVTGSRTRSVVAVDVFRGQIFAGTNLNRTRSQEAALCQALNGAVIIGRTRVRKGASVSRIHRNAGKMTPLKACILLTGSIQTASAFGALGGWGGSGLGWRSGVLPSPSPGNAVGAGFSRPTLFGRESTAGRPDVALRLNLDRHHNFADIGRGKVRAIHAVQRRLCSVVPSCAWGG